MKKLLFVLILAVACLSLVGGVFAYFQDVEESTDNSFEVGTWKSATDDGEESALATISDVYADESATINWKLKNYGTIPANIDLDISVSEYGSGCLADNMTIDLTLGGMVICDDVPVSDLEGNYDTNLPLIAGASEDLTLCWNVGDDYEHDPDDSVTVNIEFDAKPGQ
jgi:predicted ribosomally synthesized peptide with SipW-like signal peptide